MVITFDNMPPASKRNYTKKPVAPLTPQRSLRKRKVTSTSMEPETLPSKKRSRTDLSDSDDTIEVVDSEPLGGIIILDDDDDDDDDEEEFDHAVPNQSQTITFNNTSCRNHACTQSIPIPSSPVKAAITRIVTPASSPVRSATTRNTAAAAVKPEPQSVQSPPVEVDIGRFYPAIPYANLTVVKDEGNEWYDVVLSQCNITGGSNNNKYYRIQLLELNPTSFFVWTRWGRVGDSGANDLKGPFPTLIAAFKVFARKYRDKTGNLWGSPAFVSKMKKYTRIHIDHKVEVKGEYKMQFSHSSLPLGVPSMKQIQIGIDILSKIEEKLNGVTVSDSYPDLTSKFYTAIPSSFGRMKPITINTQDALHERYDMTFKLLDIFEQKVKPEETISPHISDSTSIVYLSD